MKKILILGAASGMAIEFGRLCAAEGAELHLAARDAGHLETIAKDLEVRGAAKTERYALDFADLGAHKAFLDKVKLACPDLDTVLLAYGSLPDQAACERDFQAAAHAPNVNFLSAVSLLTEIANWFEHRRSGKIAVITSVAADRGRQSNYIYGCAKAGLTTFLSGLRNRLSKSGVQVITIKPGFVDTPMTAGLKKNFLYASASQAGQGIHRAIERGKDSVYLPWFWLFIMAVIKSIPEPIFKRMKL